MNKKLYFGMMLGAIALASCSVDDGLADLEQAAPSVNPMSPVFNVTFGGDQETRVQWDGTLNNGLGSISLEQNDVLSLFHGMSTKLPETVATTDFTGYQNAIYKGGKTEGASAFTTESMVKEGLAVMVFPADTTWANEGTDAPVISISNKQDADTKKSIPYMSEILNIKPYVALDENYLNQDKPNDGGKYTAKDWNKEKSEMAGYGRKYDIMLKRVGTVLKLELKATGSLKIEGVEDPITVNSVTINTGDAEVFGTKAKVVLAPITKDSKQSFTKEYKDHSLWYGQSGIDITDYAVEISTTDIEKPSEAPVAYFTLFATKASSLWQAKDDATQTFKVIVETNYGNVSLESSDFTDANASKGNLWYRDGEKDTNNKQIYYSIPSGLRQLLEKPYDDNTAGIFKGEKIGATATRCLQVDFSNIDVNNKCISSEPELVTIQKVIAHLTQKTNNAFATQKTIFLRGDDNNEFAINTEAGRAAYQALLKVGNLSIQVCPGTDTNHSAHKKCTTLAFGNTEAAINTPDLINGVDTVKFTGNWKMGENMKLIGVHEAVKIANGANVTLQGTVSWAADQTDPKVSYDRPTIHNYGNITLGAKDVFLGVNLENEAGGVITITEAQTLSVSHGFTLTNKCNVAEAKKDLLDFTKGRGHIIVEEKDATLAANDGGAVKNLGYIKVGAESSVMLAQNQSATFDATKAMTEKVEAKPAVGTESQEGYAPAVEGKDENIAGVVDCGDNALNFRSTIGNPEISEGIVMSTKLANAAVNGVNYIRLKDKAASALKLAIPETPDKMPKPGHLYVEVVSAGNQMLVEGKCNVLIVGKDQSVRVETRTSMQVDAIVTNGKVYKPGTLMIGDKTGSDADDAYDTSKFSSYFGGKYESNKIFKY